MSNRREELEKEIEIAKKRLENAPENTPEGILGAWREELDSLSFELNNLYDDMDND
jgi:hypothetical protein